MNCPRCQSERLRVARRQGVEIDACPLCRGVWLDRGELDKIISRYDAFDREDERQNFEDYRRRQHEHQARRKSLWQELFD